MPLFQTKRTRRIVALLTAAALIALAYLLPINPALFTGLGMIWAPLFLLPEIYGE